MLDFQQKDPQVVAIEKKLREGERFYASTRKRVSEWPKMATRGEGKGKKPTSKPCYSQEEFDQFMAGGKKIEEPELTPEME